MKSYTNTEPAFSKSILVTESTDPGHADNINAAPMQLLQNTLCNKRDIDELKSAGTADGYNVEQAYQVGDYCVYDGMLYKCIADTSGEWNAECWVQTDTFGEIRSIGGEVTALSFPAFNDSGEIDGITSFLSFFERFVTGTSIYQFLANLKSGLQYVLHTGQLVNNGLCEEAGKFPLDAAYGKELQDQITGLYSDMADPIQTGIKVRNNKIYIWNGTEWVLWDVQIGTQPLPSSGFVEYVSNFVGTGSYANTGIVNVNNGLPFENEQAVLNWNNSNKNYGSVDQTWVNHGGIAIGYGTANFDLNGVKSLRANLLGGNWSMVIRPSNITISLVNNTLVPIPKDAGTSGYLRVTAHSPGGALYFGLWSLVGEYGVRS